MKKIFTLILICSCALGGWAAGMQENGLLLIEKNGKLYNAQGAEIR